MLLKAFPVVLISSHDATEFKKHPMQYIEPMPVYVEP